MIGKIPKSIALNKIQQDHRRKFPKTKERHTHRIQKTHRVPSRRYLKRRYSKHGMVKTLTIQNKESVLKAAREQIQVTNGEKPTKITANFSTKILKARRIWRNMFQVLKDEGSQPRLIFPAKLPTITE